MAAKGVVVVGGLTADLLWVVPKFPQRDRVVFAQDYRLSAGGKGFNITTALRRLGADATLISAVGSDDVAGFVRGALKKEGLPEGTIVKRPGKTDVIGVVVDKSKRPGFIGTRQANWGLTAADVRKFGHYIAGADALILTVEVPAAAIEAAITLARSRGIPVFLNLAPATKFPKRLLQGVDWLLLNEKEAAFAVGGENGAPRALCKRLLAFGAKNVVVTLGKRGCLVGDGSEMKTYPAFKVRAIDTTGAGDAFTAAFCLGLLEGKRTKEAVRFASAAAALACTKRWSRESLPAKKEVAAFLQSH